MHGLSKWGVVSFSSCSLPAITASEPASSIRSLNRPTRFSNPVERFLSSFIDRRVCVIVPLRKAGTMELKTLLAERHRALSLAGPPTGPRRPSQQLPRPIASAAPAYWPHPGLHRPVASPSQPATSQTLGGIMVQVAFRLHWRLLACCIMDALVSEQRADSPVASGHLLTSANGRSLTPLLAHSAQVEF